MLLIWFDVGGVVMLMSHCVLLLFALLLRLVIFVWVLRHVVSADDEIIISECHWQSFPLVVRISSVSRQWTHAVWQLLIPDLAYADSQYFSDGANQLVALMVSFLPSTKHDLHRI